jgi:hypothetical protein
MKGVEVGVRVVDKEGKLSRVQIKSVVPPCAFQHLGSVRRDEKSGRRGSFARTGVRSQLSRTPPSTSVTQYHSYRRGADMRAATKLYIANRTVRVSCLSSRLLAFLLSDIST